MNPLNLDFSSYRRVRRTMFGVVAATAMLLVTVTLLLLHRDMLGQIDQLEARANIGSAPNTRRHALPSETEQHISKAALDAQHALNLPWDDLLSALETVQAQSPNIHLLSVQPNPTKSEVTINGEAKDFASMMEYAQALRLQKVFYDVVLLNQRLVENNGRQHLEFNLSAGWRQEWRS